jgi:hypothetical protein
MSSSTTNTCFIDEWPRKAPKPHWSDRPERWSAPPRPYEAAGVFEVDVPRGRYILAPGCEFPPNANLNRLVDMMEGAEMHGKY